MVNRQVRVLRETDGVTKPGDIVWIEEKGAASYVAGGVAEYVDVQREDLASFVKDRRKSE